MEPGLKIEVGSPIKVDAKIGEASTDKLVDAVVDAFSPATEVMGLIGDVVRLARVEVAAAITRRAKIIADTQGMRLNAPPIKFLIPFFEKASTEDSNDENLMEMWSQLLTAAGSKYDARYLRFTSILSELSSSQARILNGIARNYNGVIGINSDPHAIFYELVESRLSSRIKGCEGKDFEEIYSEIAMEICRPGVSVVIIQAEMKPDEDMWDWTSDIVYSDAESLDFEILKSMGLLSKVDTDFVNSKHAAITVTLYHLSELGFEFWSACCDKITRSDP